MFTRRLSIILALLLSISSSSLAESSYEKGISAFLENDREDAIDHLEESILDGDKVAESHLALCFVYSQILRSDMCFYHMKEFMRTSDDPYPYIIALWGGSETGFSSYTKDKSRIAFLEELLESSSTPGKLKAMCYDALARHYKSIGEFDDAWSYALQIGQIQHWSQVGPFDNLSASGFNKDFGAVDHPEPTHSFTSSYGASIKWYEVESTLLEQWMDNYYTNYPFNSIIYSQSFIKSPKDQTVQLRFGAGGAIKLWLNDQLIYQQSEERDNEMDTYVIEVGLAKGTNRLLFQVGESDNDASNFLIRITDENGNNIQGITSDAFGKKYSKEKVEFKVLPNYEENFFEKKLEESDDIMDLIMLANAYSRNEKHYQARKSINKAIERAPNSSYLRLALASVYLVENNRTGVETIVSWLKQNDLKTPISLSLSFSEAMQSENFETADSILDIYSSEYGATVSYYEDAIDLALAREDNSDLYYFIQMAYEDFPDYALFVRYKSLVMGSRNSKNKKAIKVVKKYLKKHYDYGMYELLASHYFDGSNGRAGLDTYKELADLVPYDPDPVYILAQIYYNAGMYISALEYTEKALDIAPYRDEYWGLKGMILEELDEYSDAEDAYKRCIELYPQNYEIREKLRLLNDEKSLYDLFSKVNYYEVYKNSPSKDEYPEDNSVILRYDVQNIVYNGGGSEHRVAELVKVFNSAGIDEWKEYWIPVYSFQEGVVEKIQVLKEDGSKLDAERDGAEVVFTNLEPNDAILIIYKVKNYYFGKLTFNFWDQHYFTLGYPCIVNTYNLMIHKDIEFQYTFSNGGFEPEVSEFGEYKLYEWQKDSVEAIHQRRIHEQIC